MLTDTDGDGVSDREEWVQWHGRRAVPDTDGDGLPDAVEIAGFEITVTPMGADEFTK